jgi:aminoglycoside phosphotransferase (APT) family kinase protein
VSWRRSSSCSLGGPCREGCTDPCRQRPVCPPAIVTASIKGPDGSVVQCLLAAQHPDLAADPIGEVARGWDNVTYRLGDDLAVRLPRHDRAVGLIHTERRWSSLLAERLPIRVSEHRRAGVPGCGFAWDWSVVTWITGTPAFDQPVAARRSWAPLLSATLRALHQPAPPEAPHNPWRGVPLDERDATMRGRLEADPDRDLLTDCWRQGLAARPWAGPALWVHGDLHPANLLVHEGALTGLIDLGDLTAGDPATDLAVAWLVFDRPGRDLLRSFTDYDDDTWARSRAWAVAFVVALRSRPDEFPHLVTVADDTVRHLAGS